MLTRAYTLRFTTPAFLGNADQDGQWRTPPIKALLRQWWRVAYAADQPGAVDVHAMRKAEGQLFGVAADSDGDSRKSQVRIRLDRWSVGTLKSWDRLEQAAVEHKEVERTNHKVGPHAYLGFGPLDGKGGTRLGEKCHAAIQDNEIARLSLAYPSGKESAQLDTALWLMHQYGTLGGRSRNGWGSFSLTAADQDTPAFSSGLDVRVTARWQDALKLDWPRSIGTSDGVPLIWQTEALDDWKAVMRRLAQVKIGLRTQFVFKSGKNADQPEDRHWLSYPVTNHNVSAWREKGKGDFRLPNSLRFKVRGEASGKLRGVIFHVPCLPPPQFNPKSSAVEAVWRQVHQHLDHADRKLARIPA